MGELGTPSAERRRELTLGPIAPWHTTITVDAVSTNHGRHSSLPHDWLFEVGAAWTGPPAVGFPPSATPVSGRDVCVVEDLETARALAHLAVDAFAQGGDWAPDLRALLGRDSPAFPSRRSTLL
jgi:hypothetical protein